MSLENPFTICLNDADALAADLTGVHRPISSVVARTEQSLRLFAKFSLTGLGQDRHTPLPVAGNL